LKELGNFIFNSSNSDVKDTKFISVNETIISAYNGLIKDLRDLVDSKFRNKHQ